MGGRGREIGPILSCPFLCLLPAGTRPDVRSAEGLWRQKWSEKLQSEEHLWANTGLGVRAWLRNCSSSSGQFVLSVPLIFLELPKWVRKQSWVTRLAAPPPLSLLIPPPRLLDYSRPLLAAHGISIHVTPGDTSPFVSVMFPKSSPETPVWQSTVDLKIDGNLSQDDLVFKW